MTDELNKKKEKLMRIYHGGEQIVQDAYCSGDYESAIGMISALSDFLYNVNITYCSEILEDTLKKCSEHYITYKDNKMNLFDEKNILFFDEFGLEYRGIAVIYLKALVNLGYHVTYVTRYYRKGKISRIEDIIKGHGVVEFLERGTYKEEVEKFIEILLQNNCSKMMLYTMPQGVVGPLAYYQVKKCGVTTYKINLTDHAYWIGTKAADYFIEFRDYGAFLSARYRGINCDKLMQLPFYPEVDKSIDFQGFPFDHKDEKIIFSGGSLYKTYGDNGKYYHMVSDVLKTHSDTIFWYAGGGDISGLQWLKQRYPKRVYYTDERVDLYQILKHCDLYVATYPISGGLMGQYAALAGVVPMQLLRHEEGRLLLKDTSKLMCETYDYEELLEWIDYLLKHDNYRKKIGKEIKKQVISDTEFEERLSAVLQNNNAKNMEYIKAKKYTENVEIDTNAISYIENFPMDRLRQILCTKRTQKLDASIEKMMN